MKTRSIGPLTLSSVILGSAYFGSQLPREVSFDLLDTYYALGGRTLDTARVYGAWSPAGVGASEAVIGAWIASRQPADITLITKGAHPPAGAMHTPRLSREDILGDAEASAEALGRAPDLWLLHRDDVSRPVEEIAESLASLVERGLAKCVGASNWRTARIAEYNDYASSRGLPCFVCSQIQWSLAVTTPSAYGDDTLVCMDDREYAWYRERQFPVLAYSSQAKGFFSKAIAGGPGALSEKAKTRFASPQNLEKLELVRAEAARTGRTPASVVLQYITENAVPACAIVGCSSVAQLRDSLPCPACAGATRDSGVLSNNDSGSR